LSNDTDFRRLKNCVGNYWRARALERADSSW